MDKIQKFLVDSGRKDLAREYYRKYAAKKKQDEEIKGPSYAKILSKVKNLKTDVQLADYEKMIKADWKKTIDGFTQDKKVILKNELKRKQKRFSDEKIEQKKIKKEKAKKDKK